MARGDRSGTGVAPDPAETKTDADKIDAGAEREATGAEAEVFAVINPRLHLWDRAELVDEETGEKYVFTHEPRGLSADVYERLAEANKFDDGEVRRQVIVKDRGADAGDEE